MIEPDTKLTTAQQEAWPTLVNAGMVKAVSGLSQMVGKEIKVTSSKTKRILVRDAPHLLGGAETQAVMVYVGITGAATGHMALIYSPAIALELVDMMMGMDPGSTQRLEDLETSALGEMGNIISSFFLNTLADETELDLRPSPPAVMMDMVGAILDVVLAQILAESDDVTVVETTFGTENQQINGTFLILPTPTLVDLLLRHWHKS